MVVTGLPAWPNRGSEPTQSKTAGDVGGESGEREGEKKWGGGLLSTGKATHRCGVCQQMGESSEQQTVHVAFMIQPGRLCGPNPSFIGEKIKVYLGKHLPVIRRVFMAPP